MARGTPKILCRMCGGATSHTTSPLCLLFYANILTTWLARLQSSSKEVLENLADKDRIFSARVKQSSIAICKHFNIRSRITCAGNESRNECSKLPSLRQKLFMYPSLICPGSAWQIVIIETQLWVYLSHIPDLFWRARIPPALENESRWPLETIITGEKRKQRNK